MFTILKVNYIPAQRYGDFPVKTVGCRCKRNISVSVMNVCFFVVENVIFSRVC